MIDKDAGVAPRAMVLIIEDHDATADLLIEVLNEEGYRTTCVNTADAALAFLSSCGTTGDRNLPPDLVLMDLTMRGMDPVEMVGRLREVCPVIPPIILLSARPAAYIDSAARSIAAAGVLQKPFDIDNMLQMIKTALD